MKITTQAFSLKNIITKNPVIKGTFILIIAGFITRIIGFYNRIFLSGLIGATQMGIFQLVLPLYMVSFSITTYGNQMAVTKLVSEYKSRKEYPTAFTILKICLLYSLISGLLVAIIMGQNANWLCAKVLKAPECVDCLKFLCIGIPFMGIKGSIHGYFLGLENSSIHGISDFLEQAFKIIGVYLLVSYICVQTTYNAIFAIYGVVIAEITACAYSVTALLFHYKKNHTLYRSTSPSIYVNKAIRLFAKNTIPLTTNRLFLTVLQSIESIMIPGVLLLYYGNSTESLSHFGVFTGMAFPFIMFPATITNALSTMLLPAVSSANSTLDRNHLSKLCGNSIHFCLLIAIFSFVSFYIFGEEIGMLFFQNKEAGMYLYQLSFLCPFIYLATTLASILNGMGHITYNLILTVIATVIRISFIQFSMPSLGMTGYIIGLFVSYLFLTYACIHKTQQQINLQLHFIKSILFPGCTFTLSGILFYQLYQHCTQALQLSSRLQLILLIGVIASFASVCVLPGTLAIYKAHRQPR
ncbi:MAG: polysaccharide biosynthesis protein [Lachnospiraceae bacterium]|nr:polysaccharide biosynthesis protein [Lachnospiraceae bacterium]